jgi:sugar phosphate isomerase/epimerase
MRWSFATIVLVPRGRPVIPPSPAERRDTFVVAQGLGFGGIELTDEWLDFPALDAASLQAIRGEITDAGLRVSGLNLPRCLLSSERPASLDWDRMERALSVAASLGAEVVNFSLSQPVSGRRGASPQPMTGADSAPEERERAAELVGQLARRAESAGTVLAVELHDDGLLDTPELCLQLLGSVGQPNLGVNPDVGNLCRGPGPLPDWRGALRLLAPHARNWHLKNYRRGQPVPLQEGDIDFIEGWKIMKSCGYDGWVSVESRFGDVLAEQRSALQFLRALSEDGIEGPAP